MAIKPTYYPEWSLQDIMLPVAETDNKIRPKESLRNIGFDKDQVPTAQEENWQRKNIYDWIKYLEEKIAGVEGQPFLSLADVYPVGSIYINAEDSRNPAVIFNFGTWSAIGAGRVLLGSGTGIDTSGVTKIFEAGSQGGEYEHELTKEEIPPHQHATAWGESHNGKYGDTGSRNNAGYSLPYDHDNYEWLTSVQGGGQGHNNIQPYITVYMWKRTT